MRVKRISEAKSSSSDLYVIYFLFLGVNAAETYSPLYTVFLIPWYACGLAWIALLFNLFSKLLERTNTKLNCKWLCQDEKIISIKPSLPFWHTKASPTPSRNGETR